MPVRLGHGTHWTPVLQEQPFQVDLKHIPVTSRKRSRRARGTLPARCEEIQLDLGAAFFSSTQVLQSGLEPKAARTALAPRWPVVNRPANNKSLPHYLHGAHDSLSECCASVDAVTVQALPSAVPRTASNPAQVVQPSRRTQSMPERRCSRELQSLGVSYKSHGWKGAAPLCAATLATGSPALKEGTGREHDMFARESQFPGPASSLQGFHTGKARTRARAPALGFMLARANMQMPITKDDVAHGRRTGESTLN